MFQVVKILDFLEIIEYENLFKPIRIDKEHTYLNII